MVEGAELKRLKGRKEVKRLGQPLWSFFSCFLRVLEEKGRERRGGGGSISKYCMYLGPWNGTNRGWFMSKVTIEVDGLE